MLNSWPPNDIGLLISVIESTGVSLSVVQNKIRAVPAGRITAEHAEQLKQRRAEVVEFLQSRHQDATGGHPFTPPGPQAPGAADAASQAASDSPPVVWLIYLGTDDREHAITKDDYDDARQWIWPADCPNPDPPVKTDKWKNAVRKRWVSIPAGECPTAWVAPVYLADGTMFTREKQEAAT